MGRHNVAARRPLFQELPDQGGGRPVSPIMCPEGGGTGQHVLPGQGVKPVPVSAPVTKGRRSGHRYDRTPREEVESPKLVNFRMRPRKRGA